MVCHYAKRIGAAVYQLCGFKSHWACWWKNKNL